ncbi:MAGUK p55 subfamily member 7 isoform X1 [Centruroides vittatus]|uniref:MAGUK p55 subfamily member 7-like n=1 Tax=Centruroides sculpturatus TaxID=218467 RepID=UPI000C6D6B66|nr:MAGUK p55 subfamily member 7-like [Centruroides sculpturatus]XP_023237891.1 MAGUK p55 subfamily member 7-like [Centruroides sculpturatus]
MAVGISRNGSNGDPIVQRLLSSLEQVCNKVEGGDDERSFLYNLLQSRSFQALVFVHNKIINQDGRDIQPSSQNVIGITEEVLEEISDIPNDTAKELKEILSGPYFKAFITAHDQVARKEFLPILPEVPYEVDEEEETVKIVQLVKSNEPLGATIKYDDASGAIIIARIMHGGAADRSGLIHVGDEVHEVNGISVRGKTPHDVVNILQAKEGTITFKLVPGEDCFPARESRVRVRAHFSYDPMTDALIPCKEAGLAFSKGDILHIVNQEDPNWWQARRHGERNCRAGLIPGRQLQERRLAAMRDMSEQNDEIIPGCQLPVRKEFRPRKIKKIMYDAKENDDFDREEIATYEEVAKLYPRLGLHRPIVLIGPPGVGRNELKRRLVATDPDHYKPTIPYTSRPRKPWEVDGKEYYFASRDFIEEEIRQGRFVEHGEYKGNLYGTSLETIRSIINAGYVCVTTPHPQALKMLRTPELKPYIIFIKPPPFEQLKETRILSNARSTFDETCSRGFTDEEFHEIVYNAHKIEFLYGHLCDVTIVNDDLARSFDELLAIVKRVEVMPQWVPASWVASS